MAILELVLAVFCILLLVTFFGYLWLRLGFIHGHAGHNHDEAKMAPVYPIREESEKES